MKLTKSLFLAFAGLGLFACSNEDVVTENGGLQTGEETRVNVTLNLPRIIDNASRSGSGIVAGNETTGTTGGNIGVTINTCTVTLHAASGGATQSLKTSEQDTEGFSFTHDDTNGLSTATITFVGVINPSSIEVSVNGGSTTKLSITDINTAGIAAPLYDSKDASAFTYDSDSKTYSVTLQPAHRYARLELSGISHDMSHTDADCMFQVATLAGVYLNEVYTTEDNTTATASATTEIAWSKVSTDDYASPTWSSLGGSFLMQDAEWPAADGQCYAYSIFEGMPKVVFAATDVILNSGFVVAGWTTGGTLYATVTKFVASNADQLGDKKEACGVNAQNEITTFKEGVIYKITNIAIPDKAWGPTPDGPTTVSVVATVEVEDFLIVEGSAEWN